MTRQAIIVFAILLGAGLAGLLWYQLTRTPADQVALVSPSPTPVATQATAIPVEQSGQPTVASDTTQAPIPVSNTAPTGMSGVAMVLTGVMTLAGAYGLRRSL